MNRRDSIKAMSAGLLAVVSGNRDVFGSGFGRAITVYKSPTCGCCSAWVKHVKKAGFDVREINVEDVEPYKKRYGVPLDLASCHTGVVGDYAFEGHVPADLMLKFLDAPPRNAKGLAVPGMPLGSPGMEVLGRKDAYDVVLFDKAGTRRVFAKR
ncbi:MAG: DUF411 domain-containing protein [Gemmatimonadota bacterium]